MMLFISYHMTISVLHGVPSSNTNCTLEDRQGKSKFWNHTFP